MMSAVLICLSAVVACAPAAAATCWRHAAQRHGVSSELLVAIARAESALDPRAENRSHVTVTGTVDRGYMQINTAPRVLHRLGVRAEQLFEPCLNIDIGARILAEKFARHGNSWEAVGAYNASCSVLTGPDCQRARARYAWRVYRQLLLQRVRPLPVARSAASAPRREMGGKLP